MESDDTQRPTAWGSAPTLGSGPAGEAASEEAASEEAASEEEWSADTQSPRLQSQLDAADLDVRHRKAMVMASLFDEEPEPVKIDRFTILRKLGEGGMGVVYLVYDTQLDRRLAIKLLRDTGVSQESRSRFEREAQAMARLPHPNVVTVFEVGVHEDQLFVAMEYVAGQDLRGWMSTCERSWAQTLEQFRQAGAGLVAAHTAGIVHRDFKPDNVLVGDDGRVRVADFGLAHGFGEGMGEPGEPGEPVEDSQGKPLALALTQTGAVMGTPAYMPPEQYAGRRGDALGDQFSFCVALWEALYGERPFKGRNFGELAFALSKGELSEPADERGVPAWIRTIVTRGLAPDPEARWPSMQALLDALADDPLVRRRRFAARVSVAMGALALLGVSALGVNELEENRRQSYWSALTEQLLEVERARGLAQARDDARRARDATRMSVARVYGPQLGRVKREDPMVTTALLREAEPETRAGSEWLSTANRLLGGPITKRVLAGHRAPLGPLRFAPDGHTLYSGADDGEVRSWEVASGRGELLFAHDNLVTELELSPDGEQLATSSEDGSVRVLTLATGSLRLVHRYAKAATDLSFDASGRLLASASKDGHARVDLLDSGKFIALDDGGPPLRAVAFTPQADAVFTAGTDGVLHHWSLDGAQAHLAHNLLGHEDSIYFVRPLSSQRLVTGADDGSARLWELGGETPASTVLTQFEQPLSALDVHADRVVSGAVDGTMQVASLTTLGEGWSLPAHGAEVWSVEFTPDGEFVLSASSDNTARLTRVDGRSAPIELRAHKESLYRASIAPDGRLAATGSYDNDIRLWELQRPPLELPLDGHRGTVFSVESDPSGEWAITASHDGSARVWSMQTGALRAVLDVHDELQPYSDDLHHAVLGSEGGRAIVAQMSGAVYEFQLDADAQRKLPRRKLPTPDHAAWRLALSPSGDRLASGSSDGVARIYTLGQDTAPLELTGHRDRVFDLSFDRSGERLLTASYDGTLRVWDVASGELLDTKRGHESKLLCVRTSPDGKLWATGSADRTIRLWSSSSKHEVRVLEGHEGEVWALVFNAEGSQLASAGSDGQARVWDVASGAAIAVFADHPGRVWDVEFVAGQQLATASVDGALRLWPLSGDTPPLVLPGHSAVIQSLASGREGRSLISASVDGSARLWFIDTLSTDAQYLQQQLWAATSECLPALQRERELGEAPSEARRAHAACARRARTPN